ncbi:MAG TPA: PilZ domain-containing protein [Terriglobales bacterium]|nr:PilZ domain-containing protein [Terriglobales bacterium]
MLNLRGARNHREQRTIRNMSEHQPMRRWGRHEVTVPVEVTVFAGGQRFTLSGKAVNVSRNGLRLFISRELELGVGLLVEFLLPYTSSEIVVRAVVRNREGFSHGVEFVSVTPYQQQMIERNCQVLEMLS